MANNRIFWAVQGVIISNDGRNPSGSLVASVATAYADYSAAGTFAVDTAMAIIPRGLQSVGVTTTFNLEQVFELGQLSLYENIEEVPDIEVTFERVLDNTMLLYAAASPNSFARAASPGDDSAIGGRVADAAGMVAGANDRCDVTLAIFADTASQAGGGKSPAAAVHMSGMYVSSVSYTMPVDGNSTESLTLVGNAKMWRGINGVDATTGAYGWAAAGESVSWSTLDWDFGTTASPVGVSDDASISTADTGSLEGVTRRQNFDLANSILPRDIFGVIGTSAGNALDGNTPRIHLQNCTVSCDLGREAINELGQKEPYHRYVTFPIEVTSEFEVVSVSGDMVGADPNNDNLSSERVLIVLKGDDIDADSTVTYTKFDLGSKNKLQSVSYSGGDTGGGNVTCSYSYSTFNDLSVMTPQVKTSK
jgi:hypothetical protein